LESWRKLKWLEIAERYPQMAADEQERIQRRMRAWAKLTPEERMAAREKYKNVQHASREQREALKQLWSEYQTLPDDQKAQFKKSAAPSATGKGSPRLGIARPIATPPAATAPTPKDAPGLVVAPPPPTQAVQQTQ